MAGVYKVIDSIEGYRLIEDEMGERMIQKKCPLAIAGWVHENWIPAKKVEEFWQTLTDSYRGVRITNNRKER